MAQLTRSECFRMGFLMRCAEEGCTPEEVAARVAFGQEKSADWDVTSMFTKPVGKALSAAKFLALLPLRASGYGILAGAGLGAAGGYGLAKMQNGTLDPDEAKRQELISAYQFQAELARRRASQFSYRKAAPQSPRFS